VLLECHKLRIQGAPLGVLKIDAAPTAIVIQFVPEPPVVPVPPVPILPPLLGMPPVIGVLPPVEGLPPLPAPPLPLPPVAAVSSSSSPQLGVTMASAAQPKNRAKVLLDRSATFMILLLKVGFSLGARGSTAQSFEANAALRAAAISKLPLTGRHAYLF
jgi:hypothetical protein